MVDKVKGSFEAGSESHLPLADVLITSHQIHLQSFSTLRLTSCPYELFSVVTWSQGSIWVRQQEVLGVISTGGGEGGLGLFSGFLPHRQSLSLCHTSRFSCFLLPLASP